MNIPQVHDIEQLPRVVNTEPSRKEDKDREIQEINNGRMSLAITKCIGETQTNLDDVIIHYVGTLNKKMSQVLGMLLIFLLYPILFFFLYKFFCTECICL